jgi:hypothetical protein
MSFSGEILQTFYKIFIKLPCEEFSGAIKKISFRRERLDVVSYLKMFTTRGVKKPLRKGAEKRPFSKGFGK